MTRNIIIVAGLLLIALVWYRSRLPKFRNGEKAPDFEIELSEGEKVKLSDLRGKYVLLQFWGSWCGPCRRENPALVELYHQYHDRGFEIVSIGVEQSEAHWLNAIRQDGLVWPYHSSSFQQFEDPVARQYNIHNIPTTFLINPDGVILGVSQTPTQINKVLAEKLPGS